MIVYCNNGICTIIGAVIRSNNPNEVNIVKLGCAISASVGGFATIALETIVLHSTYSYIVSKE